MAYRRKKVNLLPAVLPVLIGVVSQEGVAAFFNSTATDFKTKLDDAVKGINFKYILAIGGVAAAMFYAFKKFIK